MYIILRAVTVKIHHVCSLWPDPVTAGVVDTEDDLALGRVAVAEDGAALLAGVVHLGALQGDAAGEVGAGLQVDLRGGGVARRGLSGDWK